MLGDRVDKAFLSRLFGGERERRRLWPVGAFLSRLFGGERLDDLIGISVQFLSRLFGGELINSKSRTV